MEKIISTMHSNTMTSHYSSYILMACILIIGCGQKTTETAVDSSSIKLSEGFEIELLYSPSDNGQGSWVSITEGPDRFYASDQYGAIYTFKAPPIGETLQAHDIDSVRLNIGSAHGLLWAHNSLYVSVAEGTDFDNQEVASSGVYRLTDTDGDGDLDTREKILTLNGTGEHGPHTLRLSPDGQYIYFIAGNFNKVPDHLDSRLPRNWDEDNVFPQYLDAMGHATDLVAPGGWLARTDPEGKNWELVAAGMRNPFSFDFNADGELFAYDADMEWDFGMPWYRPTRIVHVTSGAEFGWRTGSGKWPAYLPDNLPAVVNLDQGSPTAVFMGKNLRFPREYHRGLFACDWSFGTIYYVDLIPEGSSYRGEKREFLSGVPLPITNAIAGSDGHLYFTTGGRRTTSHLYRVRYNEELSMPGLVATDNELRALRRQLELFHHPNTPAAVKTAWPHIAHPDRHIRHAARIAVEHQGLNTWRQTYTQEEDPLRVIYATIAYARSGGKLTKQVLDKLERVSWNNLSIDQRIDLSRAYQLLLIRNRNVKDAALMNQISGRLDKYFLSDDWRLDRELSQILIYTGHRDAVAKCMAKIEVEENRASSTHPDIINAEMIKRSDQYGPQIADMLANMPPTEAIHYVALLSHARHGWTEALHADYFKWFHNALSKKGGLSYKGFLDNMRAKALSYVPDDRREKLAALAGFYSPIMEMSELPQPIGPGKEYNLMDLGSMILWNDNKLNNYTGSIADGERVFKAALCYSCHRMRGDGGASGPDLTNLYSRFSKMDMASAIVRPSEEISEQYSFTLFDMIDGKTISGRILEESADEIKIYQSPYAMNIHTVLKKTDVASRSVSPISPMPAKLLDRLNEDEISDLFVYLLSGADPDHKYYKKEL